jgi:hypothetical protein
MAKEYKKLNKVEDYDREATEELAEALNEIVELERRTDQLRELVNENEALHPFVWRTAENVSIAVHKLEDDHLRNILQHLVNHSRPISKAIRSEARSRFIDIPTGYKSMSLSGRVLGAGASSTDDEPINLDDIPF